MVSRFGGSGRSWTTGVLAGVSVFALVQAGPAIARDDTGTAKDVVAPDGAIEIAQGEPTYAFDIASKPLPEAMIDFSAVTGLEVLYTEPAPFDQTAPALESYGSDLEINCDSLARIPVSRVSTINSEAIWRVVVGTTPAWMSLSIAGSRVSDNRATETSVRR